MNNPWQRLVPVYNKETHSRSFWFFAALTALGFLLAGLRMVSPLGRYSGMNDAYAWGVWKIFNVMTLTAIAFWSQKHWVYYEASVDDAR